MAELSRHLRSEYAELDLQQVLRSPTRALLGISSEAATALQNVGIETIFDLGSSWLFANAEAATDAAKLSNSSGRFGLAPSDWLKASGSFGSLEAIGGLPLERLNGLTDGQAAELSAALDVSTIRDFAHWPPRQVARTVVGDNASAIEDREEHQSEELRPRMGEYPTERVYYNSLIMLQMGKTAEGAPLTAPVSLTPALDRNLGFVQPAVGAFVTNSQSWYAKGVTLGHMLHSLALAPGEATRIAVIDWSRRTSATATEDIAETEQLRNATEHARAISEVQNAVAEEMQSGGSMSRGWASSTSVAGAEAGSSGLVDSALWGGGSSSSTWQEASTSSFAMSSSWSVGSRKIAADMTQKVNDRTEQYANSVRNRRASAVREVSQSEHEEVSTRIVANYNHMHALTVQYYEVVQIYQVTSQLHSAERCVFVPFELLDFGGQNAMDIVERFRGALIRGALTARARDLLVDDATMVAIKPRVRIKWPRPGVIAEIPEVAVLAAAAPNPAGTGESGVEEVVVPTVTKPPLVWNRGEVLRVSRIIEHPVFRPGSDAVHLADDTELLALSFSGIGISGVQLDRPGADSNANTISVPTGSGYVDVTSSVRLSELDAISLAKTESRAASGTLSLHCSYRGRPFTAPAIPIELGSGTDMQRVVSLETDEGDRHRELLAHLQANRAHYSQAVFRSLDSATIVMLLSPFTWNGRPLVDQVEPNPLAVAGNYLVLRAPVEPEEPSGITGNGETLNWGTVLKQRGMDFGLTDIRLIPVPTGGVFAEAVLGRSNSAEKLDITRFWNWQDSPIPLQPPEILPVGTGSRSEREDLAPGALGSPVLNIVNPTNLPDPAGLSASLTTLGNANLFRDMGGLQGTQSLAQAALEKTLAAASEAGQLASTNLQTEAQKAVAMGQIASDIAKTAMGIPPMGSTKGISSDGARINHARDMDSRAVTSPPASSGGTVLPRSDKSGGGPFPGGGNGSIGGGGQTGVSREGAYADRGAFGFSPDAIGGVTSPLIQPAVMTPEDDRKAAELAPYWMNLLRFEVPQNVIQALQAREMHVQRLWDGVGDLNLDVFPVAVASFPTVNGTQLNAPGLLEHLRLNLNSFLDTNYADFRFYDKFGVDDQRWISPDPVGTVFDIYIPGDYGAVVCSARNQNGWIFTTVEAPNTGTHPISGHRGFEFVEHNGIHFFYTMATDRNTILAGGLFGLGGGMQRIVWTGMQERFTKFINDNGGNAQIVAPVIDHINWKAVVIAHRLNSELI